MRRLSARAIFALGIFYDVLAAFLYRAFTNASYASPTYGVLEFALLLSILLGFAGTLIGGAWWARRASNEAVIAAVIGIVFFGFIYNNRAKIGFDDPKVVVIPFAGLVAILLIIGRAVGHAESNR